MRFISAILLALSLIVSQNTYAETGRVIASVEKNAEIKKQYEKLQRLPKKSIQTVQRPQAKKIKKPQKLIRLGYVGKDIPAVLSSNDVLLYKKMFRLQRQNQRSQVASLVPKLQNRELMGHLIAERLLHPNTHAKYVDLKKWMSRYNDHSMAPQVYALAKSRQPRSEKYSPQKPKYSKASVAKYSDPDESTKPEVKKSRKRSALLRKLKSYRIKQYYSKAIVVLSKRENRSLLGDDTWAQVTLKLARSVFNYGDYKRSERLARLVLNRTDFRRNEALWMAGFSGYKVGKYESSASLFRRLAYGVPRNSKYFSKAAFWASKSYEAAGRESMSRVFLNLATQDSNSFYAQVAAERLGRDRLWTWSEPSVRKQDKQFLFNDPLVRRVIALSQIGEHGLAQKELKLIHERVPYDMDESLLALAMQLKLPNIQMSLARNLKERQIVFQSGLYPEPAAWKPRGGYTVDRSLMHAVMRQESAFNPSVKSHAGARGLMQLMPNTAKYIRRKHNRPVYSRHALLNPNINMSLGQDYLSYLMGQMDGNVIHVISAYNAGPGNIRKWIAKSIGNKDPLEFIESIPFKETRTYVQHVLGNLWMYKDRYREENEGLGVLAQNDWPVYKGYRNAISSK
ncbi:MAG: soluble lytic murein transglycosylase [Alphaproteobacteria bacterium]|jgi:soluble lytic murein transglycosylase